MLSAITVKILKQLAQTSTASTPALAAHKDALPALVGKGWIRKINGLQTSYAITPKGREILNGHNAQLSRLSPRNKTGLK